ncbi:MAG: hypothetical protein ACM3ML_07670 [Micromonosporaceae bacterium]
MPDESGNGLLPGAVWFDDALAGPGPDQPPVTPSPDDLYIVYTGGTTGMPKGGAPFMHGAGHWMAFLAITTGGCCVIQDNVSRLDPADV